MNPFGYQGHSDHSQANIKNGSKFGAVSLSTKEAHVEEEAELQKVSQAMSKRTAHIW